MKCTEYRCNQYVKQLSLYLKLFLLQDLYEQCEGFLSLKSLRLMLLFIAVNLVLICTNNKSGNMCLNNIMLQILILNAQLS